MLLEAMGLHVPGAAFVHPHAELREALTREAVRLVLANAGWSAAAAQRPARCCRSAGWSTSASIVNAMVALLATGGSTNHLIHWVAVARAAGIVIDWTDFAELSHAMPLLARVYPNGSADVNQFQAAGGPGFVIRELLDGGCMHARRGDGRPPAACATTRAFPSERRRRPAPGARCRRRAATTACCVRAHAPFSDEGGLKLLDRQPAAAP